MMICAQECVFFFLTSCSKILPKVMLKRFWINGIDRGDPKTIYYSLYHLVNKNLMIGFIEFILKRSKCCKSKYKMYTLRGKRATENIIELNPWLKEIKGSKKRLMLNETKGVMTSWKNLTQLSFQIIEKKF